MCDCAVHSHINHCILPLLVFLCFSKLMPPLAIFFTHTNLLCPMSIQVAFKDSTTGDIVATSASLPSSQRCITQDVTLQNGRTYIATVQTTVYGREIASSSSGIIVDNMSPGGGKLTWGASCSDMDYFRSKTAILQLCWHGFSDSNRWSGVIMQPWRMDCKVRLKMFIVVVDKS